MSQGRVHTSEFYKEKIYGLPEAAEITVKYNNQKEKKERNGKGERQ